MLIVQMFVQTFSRLSLSSFVNAFSTPSRSRKRLGAPELPEDVIEIIFDHLIPDTPFSSPDFSWNDRDADGGHTKKYIASLGLISRDWVNPTRRVLYRTIPQSYSTVQKSPLLWNTITIYPHVRNYVRRIHLIQWGYDLHPFNPFQDKVRAVLPRCTVFISIPEYKYHIFSEEMVSADIMQFLVIRCEVLVRYSNRRGMSAFSRFTHLQALQIEGSLHSRFPCVDAKGGDAYLPSLRMLRLKSVHNHIPIPLTTLNTLHTICISNCSGFTDATFFDLIRRHSVSLRRLYISGTTFTTDTPSHTLSTALSCLSGLESLIIHDMGVFLVDDILLHLPPPLIQLSLEMQAWEPISLPVFQTFLKSKASSNPMLQNIDIIWKDKNRRAMDERWLLFAHYNTRSDIRFLFPRMGERLDLPNWARLDGAGF
jgi:hypothetical protein